MIMMPIMLVLVVVATFYAVQGIKMHEEVSVQEEIFHALQDDYYTIEKSDRDTATTGSELNEQLVEIQQYPSELLRLKLVGVGKILTGIFILLFGILLALISMPSRLAMEIQKK